MLEIDARPSDAIAVAVTCDPPLPIYVSEEVLREALSESTDVAGICLNFRAATEPKNKFRAELTLPPASAYHT